MEYRYLGNSGLQVSAVGLGTNNFGRRMDREQTARVLHHALEEGVTFIDTANTYGGGLSEEFIGAALKGKRQQVVLATKAGMPIGEGPNQAGASRRHLMEQVEVSLRRLQTDYLDLFQVHAPDPRTPVEETVRTLDDLVRQGKVRYVGCSNYAAWQVCEAVWVARALGLTPMVSVQPEYSLMHREPERELLPFCERYGIGVIPYYPLAAGFLTGKYRPNEPVPAGTRLAGNERARQRFLTAENFALLGRLEAFAQERGHTVGELAIAWLLARPVVSTVIAGATTPEQVSANVRAGAWRLGPEDMAELERRLRAEE